MKHKNKSVKIIPLGGLEQIGMNITAFEYEDSIIVVDCGLAFPEDEMLGIDLVIPDVTYLQENADKVKGLVITHGHEDHIGAIPYIENQVNMPIYATKLTMGLIEHKLREHGNINNVRRKIVTHGQMITLGAFRIEFIRTTHSIADAAALAIYTPAESSCIPVISRSIIHRYSVKLSICHGLESLERRASSRLWRIPRT